MPDTPPAHPVHPKKEMDRYHDNWASGIVCNFEETTPLWHRVLCVLGYHRWEERHALHPDGEPRMRLRDQCSRCTVLR
jgi:aminoglycoside phosphotransferase (APT) family kinase protein